MGWKASIIIIHKPLQVDNEQLLKELGFDRLTKVKDELFEVVINPDNNRVYIGNYKNNLLICAPDIPMHIIENNGVEAEKILTKLFPDSEICSIVLHSTVNLWGYSIIKRGERIRVRAGSAEDGTFIDLGEPLEEEENILNKSVIDEVGQRTYAFEEIDNEVMTEDQVGENFVFAICSRYFGEELDYADALLFETTLKGYSYNKVTDAAKPIPDGKVWWKFW